MTSLPSLKSINKDLKGVSEEPQKYTLNIQTSRHKTLADKGEYFLDRIIGEAEREHQLKQDTSVMDNSYSRHRRGKSLKFSEFKRAPSKVKQNIKSFKHFHGHRDDEKLKLKVTHSIGNLQLPQLKQHGEFKKIARVLLHVDAIAERSSHVDSSIAVDLISKGEYNKKPKHRQKDMTSKANSIGTYDNPQLSIKVKIVGFEDLKPKLLRPFESFL